MAGSSYEFFTLGLSDDTTVAVIDEFDGIDGDWRLSDGERMGDRFPSSVNATLKGDRGSKLTDFLHNNEKMVVLSERARELIESEASAEDDVEYLPFVLKDKKGRDVTTHQYCVAHPLHMIDCMDKSKSKFSALDNGEVSNITVLHLRTNDIPDDAKFFRLGELPEIILLRSDLIASSEAGGLTGLNLAAMGEKLW